MDVTIDTFTATHAFKLKKKMDRRKTLKKFYILIYTKEAKTLWMFLDKNQFDLSITDLNYCTGTG